MISGGLDSSLAIALCQKQDIEVLGVHFANVFHSGKRERSTAAIDSAQSLGIEMIKRHSTDMLMKAIRNPKFGYGKHFNPCMDCREYMLRETKALLEEQNASFIISGEVIGQRPMSQRTQAIKRIDKAAGVEGLVLRPLCALTMAETIPEREGWVDRDQLLGITGRSRKRQYQLAKELGVTVFTSPAGGCLLTDPGFSARIEDLMKHCPDFNEDDVELLKFGRHLRLSPTATAVVGRNLDDNNNIAELVRPGDMLLEMTSGGSPLTLLRGSFDDEVLQTAGALTARYTRSRTLSSAEVSCWQPDQGETRETARHINVAPMGELEVDQLAIGRINE